MSFPIDLQRKLPYSVDQFAVDKAYRSHLAGILLPEGQITSRVARLAEEISADYDRKDLIALCMLDGAMRFFVELLYSEHMNVRFEVETLKAKSYAGDASTGNVTFSGFDFSKAEGRDVLIVEDIIDTGTTMRATLDKLAAQGAKSTSIAALLAKPERHQPGLQEQLAAHPLYLGFLIPDEFVVGYGLDYNGHYRGLRHLGVLNEEAFALAQTRT
ncbi:MAG: phosphoribosyltransferase family protein [Nanoarchaeota archaeon]|nr:phosphoribosyltransferase family protein [Nanoarchaeota archaeon]